VRNRENTSAPYAALLAVQAFFGSLPVIGKVVLAVIPSVGLVGFRVGITAAALVLFQLYRRRLWLRNRSDYWRLALLSLFGVTFNQLLFITGLSLTSASNTSLLAVTIPVFALSAGAIARTEKLTKRKLIGIIFAAAGVVFLIDPRNASFSSQTTTGDILIVINSLSYGIYVAISKDVVTRNGAFRSIMWIFIFASVVCVPLGVFAISDINIAVIPAGIWLLILYIAIVATTAPYILNAWALARVSPSTVAVFVYLQPVIGFLLAVIFLGEKVGMNFIVAGLLIFAGLYLTTRGPGPVAEVSPSANADVRT
jgi:drug/metabolite transporter (DMT)-like permease